MKKVACLRAVALPVLFIIVCMSCKDNEDKMLSPAKAVYEPGFIDQDTVRGKIGGILSWKLPTPEVNLEGYRIYTGEEESDKANLVGEVSKGTTSFDIPFGTVHAPFLLIVSWNSEGESNNIASLGVVDNSGEPVAQMLSFNDTDDRQGKIAGRLSWTAPTFGAEVVGYTIYTGNDPEKKEIRLGEVAADSLSFDIPEGTAFQSYLFVVNQYASGEADYVASVEVTDLYTIKGFYLLNSGHKGKNNATLDYYDFGINELVADVYKSANGTNLGDSAVQMLAYGGKRYITVPGSNRLVITDANNKQFKQIEPKAGNTLLRPSNLAADNGNVYVSYFNGHSVAVLDTASLEIKNTVTVGHNPEQLTVANGKIYVANSGKGDSPASGKTVSVIDLSSLTVEKEIAVAAIPSQIASGSQGHVYVLSMTNDSTIGTLQAIDPQTNSVNTIGSGIGMTLVNDNLYVMEAARDSSGITIKKYDALTAIVSTDNLIADKTVILNPGTIAVDPLTEKVYVSEQTEDANTVFVFTADGKADSTIETKGFNTRWITFLKK